MRHFLFVLFLIACDEEGSSTIPRGPSTGGAGGGGGTANAGMGNAGSAGTPVTPALCANASTTTPTEVLGIYDDVFGDFDVRGSNLVAAPWEGLGVGKIYVVDLETGERRVFAEGRDAPGRTQLTADYVYWQDAEGILRQRLDGSAPLEVLLPVEQERWTLLIVGETPYVYRAGEFAKLNPETRELTNLGGSEIDSVRGVTATSEHFYYAGCDGLARIPLSGGATEQLATTACAWRPATDGRDLYFALIEDARFVLWRVLAEGGTPERVEVDYQPPDGSGNTLRGVAEVALDRSYVYAGTDRGIIRIDRATGEQAELGNLAGVDYLRQDAACLYWSLFGSISVLHK